MTRNRFLGRSKLVETHAIHEVSLGDARETAKMGNGRQIAEGGTWSDSVVVAHPRIDELLSMLDVMRSDRRWREVGLSRNTSAATDAGRFARALSRKKRRKPATDVTGSVASLPGRV